MMIDFALKFPLISHQEPGNTNSGPNRYFIAALLPQKQVQLILVDYYFVMENSQDKVTRYEEFLNETLKTRLRCALGSFSCNYFCSSFAGLGCLDFF